MRLISSVVDRSCYPLREHTNHYWCIPVLPMLRMLENLDPTINIVKGVLLCDVEHNHGTSCSLIIWRNDCSIAFLFKLMHLILVLLYPTIEPLLLCPQSQVACLRTRPELIDEFTPTVVLVSSENSSLVNLVMMLVLPTPESPKPIEYFTYNNYLVLVIVIIRISHYIKYKCQPTLSDYKISHAPKSSTSIGLLSNGSLTPWPWTDALKQWMTWV